MPVNVTRARKLLYSRRRSVRKPFRKTMRNVANREIQKYAETHRAVATISGGTYDYAGTVVPLSNISQGDSTTTRTGSVIVYKNYVGKYTITLGDTVNLVRILIFRWKPDDSEHYPASSDLLLNTGSALAPLSNINPTHRKNFSVYVDRLHTLQTYKPIVTGKFSLTKRKLGAQKSRYNSDDSGSNKLWMLIISDSGAVSHPAVNLYSDLKWIDM